MKIKLYHGTSIKNADGIMAHGFKDRVGAGRSNWHEKIASQEGYVYLSSAYAIYFAMAAAKRGKRASIIKVEVDTDDLYPDEDILHFLGVPEDVYRDKLHRYQELAEKSLNELGNVAISADAAIKILGRRDFEVGEMWRFSDPSISPMNYMILGGYYRELTNRVFNGEPYEHLQHTDFLEHALQS